MHPGFSSLQCPVRLRWDLFDDGVIRRDTICDLRSSTARQQCRYACLPFRAIKTASLLLTNPSQERQNCCQGETLASAYSKVHFRNQQYAAYCQQKKCEINVKHIISGRTSAVSGTMANPASFKFYKTYHHLQDRIIGVYHKMEEASSDIFPEDSKSNKAFALYIC